MHPIGENILFVMCISLFMHPIPFLMKQKICFIWCNIIMDYNKSLMKAYQLIYEKLWMIFAIKV